MGSYDNQMGNDHTLERNRREAPGQVRRELWPVADGWICNSMVIRQGKVLLLRRAEDGFLGGQWDLPGGKLDAGEEPEVCARRELCEEAGLQAAELSELAHYTDPDHHRDGSRFHVVTFRAVESDSSAPVHLSEEHPEYRWVAKSELSTLTVVSYVHRVLTALQW